MRINLILACVFGLIIFVSATHALAEDKVDSVVLPPDTVVIPHTKPPEFKKEVEPEYPRMAKESGFSAIVEVKAFIDSTGTVVKAHATTTKPSLGFEEAAAKAAYKSTFYPATIKRKPVGVWIRYKYVFKPDKGISRKAIHSYDLE